jgi:hypothetical protein
MIQPVSSKRLVIQFVALILFVAATSGYVGWRMGASPIRSGPPPMQSIEETLAELTKELNLTDQQLLKIRPILEKRQRLAAEHARAMAGRMNVFAEEMRETLDERQRAIFDERTREIRAKAQQRRPHLGPDSGSESVPKK